MSKTAKLLEKLQTGLHDYIESGKYEELLRIMSRFHDYSFNNCLLIATQCPHASYVAGYHSWRTNFHRQVKRGAKAISIISPMPYKKKNESTGEEEERLGFRAASVFDISDTYQIPDMEAVQIGVPDLEGNVENFKDFIRALEKLSPVPVSYELFDDKSSKGYFCEQDCQIVIQDGMTERQTMKTLVHEVAHSLLHTKEQLKDGTRDKRQIEIEAESVAFAVCTHYNVDVEEYSFPYIVGWSRGEGEKRVMQSMKTIQETADKIIKGIDSHFETLK